jgi:hypothetical protein
MTIAPLLMNRQFVSRIGTRRMDRIGSNDQGMASGGRAVAVIEPVDSDVLRGTTHPSAAFIAQLLAIRAGLPQTRDRRRAEPDEATRSYGVSMLPLPVGSGRVLSRVM